MVLDMKGRQIFENDVVVDIRSGKLYRVSTLSDEERRVVLTVFDESRFRDDGPLFANPESLCKYVRLIRRGPPAF